jgi:hypothetical protein
MPAQASSSWDSMLKILNTKKGWWSDSRCRPWVQTLVLPKNKKIKNNHYWPPSFPLQIVILTGFITLITVNVINTKLFSCLCPHLGFNRPSFKAHRFSLAWECYANFLIKQVVQRSHEEINEIMTVTTVWRRNTLFGARCCHSNGL